MQNINVNIVPDNFPQTIRYSQGDIGRQFKINVADFDIPVGATVKIQATKPSGFGFSVAGTVSDNSVTFTTTEEMTDEAGRFQAELQITSGDDVIGTANFLMIGERNPHPEGTTDGSQGTIIPELTLLVERVEKAASDVLDMEVVATTLPAGSQATYSYDEDLNKATFGIPEGQAGAGAAGVVASAYSAAKTYKVGDYVLYNSNLYRCTTAITTAEAWTAAHWTQVVLADDVTDLKSDLDGLSIEGFEQEKDVVTGTLYKDYIFGTSLVPNVGSNVLEANIEGGAKYLITGTGNPLYQIYDANNVRITGYNPGSFVDVTDYELIAPTNANKIYINRRNANPILKNVESNKYIAVVPTIATKESDSKYIIGTDAYTNEILLDGTPNGTFNYNTLKRNGNTFKAVNDDIAPIYFGGADNVGANHGFYFGYDLTINSHGLTESDIGKTYNDGTNTWVLIKIVSANTIEVICYDSSAWYKMKTSTPPATVNFGSSLTVTASSRVQIFPSVKNKTIEVIENTLEDFAVLECYDIIDIGTGIEEIKNNVGSNTNGSIVELSDSVVSVRNVYQFLNNGSITIYQNLKKLKDDVRIGFYSGLQSIGFDGTNYFAVPQTEIDYQAVGNTDIYFTKATWDDSTKAPIMYLQSDGSKAMILGFLGSDRTSGLYSSAGYIRSATKKLYPYLVEPPRIDGKGTVYQNISFRVPCVLNDISNDIAYMGYCKCYDDYYLIISTDSAKNVGVKLPPTLWNRKAEVFMTDGIACNTEYVTDSVDIISEGRGYLILKLSK